MIGLRSGRLTVVRQGENYISPKGYPHKRWECVCDCGTTISVRGNSLKNGHTKSCGCLRKELKQKPFGEATLNAAFLDYFHSARYRGYSFSLSKSDFKEITLQDCHYCGSPPAPRYRHRTNGECVINGIDRVDNTRGYEKDNIVPCCSRCNIAKSTMTKVDFLKLVKDIYTRHFKDKYETSDCR